MLKAERGKEVRAEVGEEEVVVESEEMIGREV